MNNKPVKCKYCDRTVGHRDNNIFTPANGTPQLHKRSFFFQCKDISCRFADEWQLFAVNQNDVKKFEFKTVMDFGLKTA